MVFAIPSYKRQNKQETARYLHELGIPTTQVYIFAYSQEYDAYRGENKDISTVVGMEVDKMTIPYARNYILDYFKGEENIVMLDDDISCISFGSKEKKTDN